MDHGCLLKSFYNSLTIRVCFHKEYIHVIIYIVSILQTMLFKCANLHWNLSKNGVVLVNIFYSRVILTLFRHIYCLETQMPYYSYYEIRLIKTYLKTVVYFWFILGNRFSAFRLFSARLHVLCATVAQKGPPLEPCHILLK